MANSLVHQITSMILFTIIVKGINCQSGRSVVTAINERGDRLEFAELADLLGLPVERYSVITEDRYILSLFHIPGRRKPPILFVPGIAQASESWLLRGHNSLPSVLAKQGHDMWFLTVRGSINSRRHVTLDPNVDAEFWDYSFHEHGYYDLPAVIDVILKLTNATSVNAITHSQANTMFYVLLSTRPEYNSKVNLKIGLAPVAFLDNLGPPSSIAFNQIDEIDILLRSFGVNEFFGYNQTATKIVRNTCSTPVVGYIVCLYGARFPVDGFDSTELEPSFYRITNYYFPVGTSRKNVIHFGQIGKSGAFRQYDYGADANIAIYNSTTPPEYNLSNIVSPIVLLVGGNDRLATPENAMRLRDQLPNVRQFTILPRRRANHLDFVWGRTMQDYLVPYILRALS